MRVSLEHLSSYFDKALLDSNGILMPEIVLDIVEKLTLAGIELEKIIPQLDDQFNILEFKITPNRGDCLSIHGLVREIGLLTTYQPIYKEFVSNIDYTEVASSNIDIQAPAACFNYCNLAITGIDNNLPLPDLITKRLSSAGFNSICAVVDILNYVMLETGQPLHGYKYNSINQGVKLRYAYAGEQVLLLNNATVVLDNNTLVLVNFEDEIVAIAGVMGSLASSISLNCRDIILESCHFIPDVVMGKAKLYNLSSDAVYRFERGVDANLAKSAITLASQLIIKYLGGTVGTLYTANPYITPQIKIKLTYQQINHLIGQQINKDQINNILIKLGCKLHTQTMDELEIVPPSHRFDLKIAQDIIEEVTRIYGYNNIDPVFPQGYSYFTPLNPIDTKVRSIRSKLVSLGYNEVINYAFVEESIEQKFGYPEVVKVGLKNPLANLNYMRSSLIGGLIQNLESNLKRGAKLASIFEIANVFHGEQLQDQRLKAAGLIYNSHQDISWLKPNLKLDFYDLKHDVEILLDNKDYSFVELTNYALFHPSRCVKIICNQIEVGVMGQLHPNIALELAITNAPYLFELDIEYLLASQEQNYIYRPVSKYQKVERDLSFIVEPKTKVSQMLDLVKLSDIKNLISANIFDIYIPDTNSDKSVAIKFIFQANKTLQENDIKDSLDAIIDLMFKHFNAKIKQ